MTCTFSTFLKNEKGHEVVNTSDVLWSWDNKTIDYSFKFHDVNFAIFRMTFILKEMETRNPWCCLFLFYKCIGYHCSQATRYDRTNYVCQQKRYRCNTEKNSFTVKLKFVSKNCVEKKFHSSLFVTLTASSSSLLLLYDRLLVPL